MGKGITPQLIEKTYKEDNDGLTISGQAIVRSYISVTFTR